MAENSAACRVKVYLLSSTRVFGCRSWICVQLLDQRPHSLLRCYTLTWRCHSQVKTHTDQDVNSELLLISFE